MSIHPHLKQAHVLVNIFLLASWALLVTPSLAADITGQVISILDGDTIEVLPNGRGASKQIQASTFRYGIGRVDIHASLDNFSNSSLAVCLHSLLCMAWKRMTVMVHS